MSDIKEFLKLYNQLEFGGCGVMISDHTNDCWDADGDCFWWEDSEGFYSEDVLEGLYYDGEYVIFNGETGCGTTITRFFLAANRTENLSGYEEDFDDQ